MLREEMSRSEVHVSLYRDVGRFRLRKKKKEHGQSEPRAEERR
jgi:hypothetical protein